MNQTLLFDSKSFQVSGRRHGACETSCAENIRGPQKGMVVSSREESGKAA